MGSVGRGPTWLMSALLALAGCYSPRPPSGAPCGPNAACPAGLTCETRDGADVCVEPGGGMPDADDDDDGGDTPDDATDDATDDAIPIDAMPDADPNDPDGDGVLGDEDNCPTLPNPMQWDEDGDARGDDCDPCPMYASGSALDSDGDGIGDACDPRPGAPDRRLRFEGFRSGMADPTWTLDGAVMFGEGYVEITGGSLLLPIMSTTEATLVAGGTFLEGNGTPYPLAGVLFSSDDQHYVFCGPEIIAGTHILRVAYAPSGDLDGANFNFIVPHAFEITLRRGNDGVCKATANAVGASVALQAIPEPSTMVAITAMAAKARFDWIFVTMPEN